MKRLMLRDVEIPEFNSLLRKLRKHAETKAEQEVIEVLQVRLSKLSQVDEGSMYVSNVVGFLRRIRHLGFGLVNFERNHDELDDKDVLANLLTLVQQRFESSDGQPISEEDARTLLDNMLMFSYTPPDAILDHSRTGGNISEFFGHLFGGSGHTSSGHLEHLSEEFIRGSYFQSIGKNDVKECLNTPVEMQVRSLIAAWTMDYFLPLYGMSWLRQVRNPSHYSMVKSSLDTANRNLKLFLGEPKYRKAFDKIVSEMNDYEPQKKYLCELFGIKFFTGI
ncbi:hypothetical protein [Vibrio parahaemolyticus]|uniref:hypothetical protein n=1 Tax=Vibrio parahaemolyticus TaxID=670 RepID=UPI0023EC2DF9|nr:hypothetical protein [Vibrio parahaemolyticus]